MNTRLRQILLPAGCVLAAAAGWLLAGSPASGETGPARRITGPSRGAQEKPVTAPFVEDHGGGFAHLKAVAARMAAGSGTRLPASGSLASEEAEELAARLAGESLAGRAASDPAGFLEQLAGADYNVRDSALRAWAGRDPRQALTVLLTAPEAEGITIAPAIAVAAGQDLSLAISLLEQQPQSNPRLGDAWEAVFQEWAKTDAAGLKAKLPSLGSRATAAITALSAVLAKEDPQAAVQWALSLPEQFKPGQAFNKVIETLAYTNPRQAAELLVQHPNQRAGGIWSLAHHWSRRDPEEALRWAADHPGFSMSGQIGTNALPQAAAENPALAQAYYNTLAEDARPDAAMRIASSMAGKDPAGALRWAQSLPAGTARDNALAAAALANRDPALTATFIQAAPGAAPALLMKTDPAAAAAAFAALPAGQQRGAFELVTKPERFADTASSVRFAEALPEGEHRTTAAVRVAVEWAATDPAAASAWVAGLPEGDSRTWAARNLAADWGRRDPAAARQWAEALPAGRARVQALDALNPPAPENR